MYEVPELHVEVDCVLALQHVNVEGGRIVNLGQYHTNLPGRRRLWAHTLADSGFARQNVVVKIVLDLLMLGESIRCNVGAWSGW